MIYPNAYFSDPRERELVDLVWERAATSDNGGFFKSPFVTTLVMGTRNQMIRRALRASDIITSSRGDGESGSNAAVNSAFGKPEGYFTDKQIGNIEHFFRAAFLAHVCMPAGSLTLSATYDLALDPLVKRPIMHALKAYRETEYPAEKGFFEGFFEKMEWDYINANSPSVFRENYNQFIDADRKGVRFYISISNPIDLSPLEQLSNEAIVQMVNDGVVAYKDVLRAAARAKPLPNLGAGTGETCPVNVFQKDYLVSRARMMMSKISEERYQTLHLWPLIWDANKTKVPNPNQIPAGILLKIPDHTKFSPGQLTEYKNRSSTWRNFPAG